MAVLRLQLASTPLTCLSGRLLGSDAADQSATQGTQAARSTRIQSRYRANCRNERNAVVSNFAVLRASDDARSCTKPTTSAAMRRERSIAPIPKRYVNNC